MSEGFNLFIDYALYNVLGFKINGADDSTNTASTFELKELVVDDVRYAVITNNHIVLEDICELGSGMFYTMHNWNNIVDERQADAIILPDMAFNDFEYNYGLITNIKEANRKNDNDLTISGPAVFKASVNNLRGFEVVDKYNFQFNTRFKVTAITDVDGLGTATIVGTNINLIDVLGLGFMICLDDVLKSDLSAQY